MNLAFDGSTNDSSSNRFTFTEAGTMRYAVDRFGVAGRAIEFVTAPPDSRFLRGSGPSLAGQSQSVSFWIKKNGQSPGWLFSLGDGVSPGSLGREAHVYIGEGMLVGYAFFYDGFDTPFVPVPGAWYHWAFTFDATTRARRFYVNGSLVATNQAVFGFSGGNFFGMSATNMSFDDFRIYNRALSATDVAALAASPAAPRPVILSQPATNVAVAVGQTLALSVQATGGGVLSYQWSKDALSIPGATSATFSRSDFQASDAGSYAVTISNYAGALQSAASSVTVGASPAFTAQPQSKVASIGENVTLMAQAAAASPITYQWLKDGLAIAGATNATLTISNVQPVRTGDYAIVATAAGAMSTSATASVTIAGVPAGIWKGLVAYYPFDGTAVDQSVLANNATPAGNSQFLSNGLTDGALRIVGDNSLFYSGGGHALLPQFGPYMNSGFTVSLWVKDEVLGSDPVGEEHYVSFGILDQAQTGIALRDRSGRLWADFYMDSGLGGAAHLNAVTVSKELGARMSVAVGWKHLTMTYRPGRFAAFLNGERVGEQIITSNNFPVTQAALGRHWWSGGLASSARMSATYDNVRIYARALTDLDVQQLYASEAPTVAPVVATQPAAQAIVEGQPMTLSVAATGSTPMSFQWKRNDIPIQGATSATLKLNAVQAADAGAYTVTITNAAGAVTTVPAMLVVKSANPGRLSNLSIRTVSAAGSGTLIVGFVLGGSGTAATAPLLTRASGPALAQFGVAGTLPDPQLSLYDGARLIASNDNWSGADIAASASAVGAFAFPQSSKDAAISSALPAANYTAQVLDVGGATGVALVEIYETSADFSYARPRLINISARATPGTGDATMIAGFVVKGETPVTVLIRGVGPTLSQFGVVGALANPRLTLLRDATLVTANDNWGDLSASAISATAAAVGAFALPTGSLDSAILATLQPGSYTVQIAGANNTQGVALIEVYEVP